MRQCRPIPRPGWPSSPLQSVSTAVRFAKHFYVHCASSIDMLPTTVLLFVLHFVAADIRKFSTILFSNFLRVMLDDKDGVFFLKKARLVSEN